MSVDRKLAAILCADVVGYSRLIASDEEGTVRRLRAYREMVDGLIASHRGRVFGTAGDSVIAEFASPVEAVRCAVTIQRETATRNKTLPASHRMQLRIGVNLGDVVVEGDNLLGGGVNIAARLEGIADPGGILVSDDVRRQVRSQLDLGFEDLGKRALKNIPEPVHVYRVQADGERAAVAAAHRSIGVPMALTLFVVMLIAFGVWLYTLPTTSRQPGTDATTTSRATDGSQPFGDRPAIAVLPFDNLSPDPDQAFFADGLAEDLITRLASWRAFPVIARNSSFQYRGGNLDLKRVGAELGARYLVEGSVRRLGDRIRVTAQLIEAESAEHVWAETYDRAVADVFALQDEIGSTIAASLVGDLTRAEGERARQQGTENLEAWSFYQLGLQHADRYTAEDSVEAARLFARAVELDPRFATAIARLALENWMMVSGDGRVATAEQVADALATARRAVELDPRDPVAHVALGAVYLTAGKPKNAVDATRKAVELNPSMPEAWIWFGWAQLLAGAPEACIVATERAKALDPQRSMVWVYDSLALANWETGRYADALEAGRRLVAVQPTYFTGYLYVAMSALSLGKIDEAQAAVVEGRRVRPDLSIELMQNYLAVSRPEADARRNAALRKAGLE